MALFFDHVCSGSKLGEGNAGWKLGAREHASTFVVFIPAIQIAPTEARTVNLFPSIAVRHPIRGSGTAQDVPDGDEVADGGAAAVAGVVINHR